MDNRRKILIVEDEPEIFKSTLSFLSENDFICTHCIDLKSANKVIKNNFSHAALLDLGLPDGDGLSLIKKLNLKTLILG